MNNGTDRAKQFLAFAALSGFERLLEEQEEAAAQKERSEKAGQTPEPSEPPPEDGI